MTGLLYALSIVSLLLAGAIFGFFYAWLCSTMWGLDAVDPLVAITAMQSINVSIRNAVFAMAFFGTPMALLVTAFIARADRRKSAALAFALAAVVYAGGAFVPTALVSVPMNEALASVAPAIVRASAETIWRDYSAPWQFWNTVRTAGCAATLALTGLGLMQLHRRIA